MPKSKKIKPRKTPQQDRSQDKVEFILAAAATILEESTLDESTTTQIAKKAGVSIGSLYQFFPNKESIVVALLERQIKQNMDVIGRVFAQRADGTLEDLVTAITKEICVLFFSKREFFRNLFVHVGQFNLFILIAQSRVHFVKQMEQMIPTRKAATIINAIMGIIWGNVFSEQEEIPTEIVAEEMRRLALGYLSRD